MNVYLWTAHRGFLMGALMAVVVTILVGIGAVHAASSSPPERSFDSGTPRTQSFLLSSGEVQDREAAEESRVFNISFEVPDAVEIWESPHAIGISHTGFFQQENTELYDGYVLSVSYIPYSKGEHIDLIGQHHVGDSSLYGPDIEEYASYVQDEREIIQYAARSDDGPYSVWLYDMETGYIELIVAIAGFGTSRYTQEVSKILDSMVVHAQ